MENILNLYSIYDKSLDCYYSPLVEYNDNNICRQVRDVVNELGNFINRCPANYTLYCVGQFNCETGDILPMHRKVIEVKDLVYHESEEENET